MILLIESVRCFGLGIGVSVALHLLANPCLDPQLNDCSKNAVCMRSAGGANGFVCKCLVGHFDAEASTRPGRVCVPDSSGIGIGGAVQETSFRAFIPQPVLQPTDGMPSLSVF